MSIKDLFNDYKSNQFSPSQSELSASKLAESTEFIQNKFVEKFRYEPPIDFTTASNFAKFGSAELYYEYAFKRIYQQYPYDGSLAEQQEFHNNSTFLDKYIFEHVYPRTTGHIIFSSEDAKATGMSGPPNDTDDYGNPDTVQYISVFGGPHTASGGMTGKDLAITFDESMIYDESKDRVGSFEWNPTSGSTIEFWMKKNSFAGSGTQREVILDIWNGEATGSPKYGRIRLELYKTGSSPMNITMVSGATNIKHLDITPSTFTSASLIDNQWHHYAVTLESTNAPLTTINLYRDGTYLHTTSSANYIGPIKNVTGGVNAYIGALQTATSGKTNGTGWGKLSASLDEFRYWKKKRTTNEIGEYWFVNMGGGTNKREYNTDLGVYFKFNEGITGNSTTDQSILDYSGRISNGIMIGYTASARSTDSALESLTNVEEYKDPIIYSSHPTVSSSLATYKATGSLQDYENTSLFYNLFPSWIIEEDYENGQNLRHLTQIMASYFDTLNAQISGVTEFKNKRYFSGSAKPNTYAREVLRGQGFVIPDIFIEADILEEMRGKDDNETYDKDIQKVKNLIYQNIYNNLNYIYKSKGTEKSFRNLFRCFGVDSELLKLNLYSDDSTYLYKDNYEFTSIAKPVLNLNKETQIDGTVYLSSSNGHTYLSSSEGDNEQYTSMTFECEAIFPYKFQPFETGYFPTPFVSSSIAGFHRAQTSNPSNLAWHSSDTDLRIYAVKQSNESRHAKFVLTGSQVQIESPVFREVFDNNKWILAARVRHDKYPFAGKTTGTITGGKYTVEFYGVNSVANDVKNEFSLTASVTNTHGKKLLSHAKRIYAGAHRQDFNGSVLQGSEVKVSQVRFWQSHLSDEELKEHSYDPTNYGLMHPYRSDAAFQVSGSEQVYVPQIETLALHWDFMNVTASDSSGKFVVNDISSGSTESANEYSMIGKITKNKYDGYAEGFDTSSVDVVDKEFIYTAKKRLPDEVYSSDGVTIKTDITENFFEDNAVSDHFYMFEKSPYNAVSQQMINFFGSMKDFNSLIGDPAERYRFEYKQMNDLKKLFFERVENIPDPERFFEYFKWIDTSISYAISQLIPASSRFAEDVKDIVESHVLERNKYQEKFPLTAQQTSTEGIIKSFSEISYNWRFGHAPIDGSDNKNCLWQKIRRRISNANVQTLRDNIYKTSNTELSKLYDFVTSQVYEGNTDAVRRLSRPYRLNMDLHQNIHGGTNYYVAKNRDFVLEVVHPHSPTSATGIPKNVLVVGVGTGQGLVPETICQDEEHPLYKEKYKFDASDGRFSTDQLNAPISQFAGYKHFVKGIRTFPMNIMSQSTAVNTGYQAQVSSSYSPTAYITNLHSDTTDRTNTVPMQGPFTERHIGGHQSRHISINKYDAALKDDDTGTAPPNNLHNIYTRQEAWRLLMGENPNDAVVDGALGFTPPDYGTSGSSGIYPDVAKKRASFYREEKAKRPINIKNIKHRESGSVVGNYKNNYEFLMLQGRRENNLYFRDNPELTNYLPIQYTSSLPHTTHVMSLVGIDPTPEGNVFGKHVNNMQPDKQLISAEVAGTPANGSFSISGSTINGSASNGSFSFTRNTIAPTSASIQFTAKGRTIEQVEASGSFVVTASHVAGTAASGSFIVKRPPYHTGHQGSFRVTSKDFLLEPGNGITITQDPSGSPAADKFGYDVNGNTADNTGLSVDHLVATASTITATYTNLKNSISSSTVYTSTSFSATAPTYGVGVWNNGTSVNTFLSGTFSARHWAATDPWSMAFWMYLSSSNSTEGNIFCEYAAPGFTSNLVRRVYVDSSNKLVYEKYFDDTSPGPATVVTASWAGTIPSTALNKWSHFVISSNGASGTSGANAIPSTVNVRENGGEISSITHTANGKDGIDAIVTGSMKYSFFGCSEAANTKSLLAGIDEPGLWNVQLNVPTDDVALYNNGLYAPRTSVSSSQLKAWWRFGDDGNITGGGAFDPDGSRTLTTNDLLEEQQSNQHATASENGTDLYLIDPSIYETAGYADFTVSTSNTGSGLTGTIAGTGTNYSNISNIVTITQSGAGLTTQDGDTITLNSKVFELDSNSSVTGLNTAVAFTTNQNKTNFWNVLSASIKANTDFDTISITDNGNNATFSITSSTIGSSRNGDITTETGTSFSSLVTSAGGSNASGATDGHFITIDGVKFELDHDSSVSESGTHRSIDSSAGVSNSTFWNSLSASIKTYTDLDTITVSDLGNGTARFSLTASTGGATNNTTITATGGSFSSLVGLAGGVTQSGSIDGKYIILAASADAADLKKFIVETSDGSKSDNTPTNSFYVDSSVATNAQFWNNLSQSIKDRGFGCSVSAGTNQATFTVTSYLTGASGNTGYGSSTDGTSTFNVVSSPFQFSGGSDTGDNNDGNTFTLDGTIFELDSNSTFTGGTTNIASSGSLTNTQIFNNITASIKAQTDFNIVTYSTVGSTATFAITSSVTGTVKNGKFTAGTGFTMQSQTAGGTDESGSTDGDTILIDGVTFELDNNSSVTGGNTAVDCSDSISNTNFWNSLTASIITNTVYDTVTYSTAGSTATFALTSSTTGSALNTAITETGNSFSVIRGMEDGTDKIPAVFSQYDVVLAVPTPTLRNGDQNKTIISSRFAAPGGIEIESNAYLDVYARELSVHNALPFRNLTVRGGKIRASGSTNIGGSGEANDIRVIDHLGKRRGLNTLLSLHCGQFGIDSQYGAIVEATYSTSGSFNKQHRNNSRRMIYDGRSTATGSMFDNAFVSTPIPRSEFQYSWINNAVSHSSSPSWRNSQRILGYQNPDGLVSSSAGIVEAIVFPSSSNIT